jgi:predicted RNase H-like HicB family nuclease
MRYAVVIEKGTKSFGAYVPDLPGCGAAARTRAGVVRLIKGTIAFHIEGLKEHGQRVPKPVSSFEFVEVAM